MANPSPSPSTRFRRGNAGGGRKRGLVRTDDLKRIFGKFWKMTKADLLAVLKDETTPVGELMVASIMAQVAKNGDANRLNVLLDRVFGRPREEEPEEAGAEQRSFDMAYPK